MQNQKEPSGARQSPGKKEHLLPPRPEAHALAWEQLFSPIRRAVEQLLVQLDAITSIDASVEEPEVARCFLVSGEPGCGKTTVLLTASQLCSSRREVVEEQAVEEARHNLEPRVRWLNVVDVAPMPARTNFLTMLLVAVRSALDSSHSGGGDIPRRSNLFQESRSEPIEAIDRLINDSALVWEEIDEPSTRERAHRQVSAAERFMDFRDRLSKAFAMVGRVLAQQERGMDKALTLIVPVDNINRSAEHLRQIFKLAQWVTCPHLNLVLAGDRADMHSLLERSYWAEFRQVEGMADHSSANSGSDDEAQSLARRQAAGAIRRLLPPEQRIDVKPIEAKSVLDFHMEGADKSIGQLLGNLPVEYGKRPDEALVEKRYFKQTTLRDLLVARCEVEPAGDREPAASTAGKEPSPVASVEETPAELRRDEKPSELAEWALRLPARAIYDLWLLAQSVQPGPFKPGNDDEARRSMHDVLKTTAHVVRSMVRLSIAESELPHWAVQLLQHKVIRRSADNWTQLVMSEAGHAVEVHRICSHEIRAEFPGGDAGDFCETRFNKRHELRVRVTDGAHAPAELPTVAAAWLLILHDVLMFAPYPLVTKGPGDLRGAAAPSASTTWYRWHDGRNLALEFAWPRPKWGSFYEHATMDDAWNSVLDHVRDDPDGKLEVRRLFLWWLHVVLWAGEDIPGVGTPREPYKVRPLTGNLHKKLGEILEEARILCRKLECSVGLCGRETTTRDVRRKALYDWLVLELPRFFTGELQTFFVGAPEFSPHSHVPDSKRLNSWRRAGIWRAVREACRSAQFTGAPAAEEDVVRDLADTLARAFKVPHEDESNPQLQARD